VNDHERVELLRRLAALAGVELAYSDVFGNRHEAGVEPLLAVLASLGIEVDGLASVPAARARHEELHGSSPTDPVLVAWEDEVFAFDLRVPAGARARRVDLTVELEAGGEVPLGSVDLADCAVGEDHGTAGSFRRYRITPVPTSLPVGYHRLGLTLGRGRGGPGEAVHPALFVAPARVAQLDPRERLWGVFAPVYSLPGGSGLGANVGELDTLGRTIDRFGGKIVGTLPLLAAWLTEPFDPSPYAPVSRRFWNELFVDLAALPELASVPTAAANLAGLRSIGHAANDKGRTFDYRHQYGYVRGVLEQVIAGIDSWDLGARSAFLAWADPVRSDVSDFAHFRAFAEAQRSPWRSWPERQRSGRIEAGDVDPARVRFHEYAQFATARSLDQLKATLTERDQRLYLDLPVGAHVDGYDTWRNPELFGWGASAGAPPDEFFREGQTWGFPPVLPQASREQGHRLARDVIAHHMRAARILRLDHVMGLHRLFWVPDGMSARDGVYVRYPREELFALLAIESCRHQCAVVGEDLGTVPHEIGETMRHRGLLGMYVAEFKQPSWPGAEPEAPRADQLATIDTHDTPTLTGWLRGLDITRAEAAGLCSDDEARVWREARRQQVDNLNAALANRAVLRPGSSRAGHGDHDHDHDHDRDRDRGEGELLEGLLRFLGDSDAPAVIVALDDLVGEGNPQNVPGTGVDRPNWVQRVPFTTDELVGDEWLVGLWRALQDCRLGSHLRAQQRSESSSRSESWVQSSAGES
jgi:4-alpha-glucanotransferase